MRGPHGEDGRTRATWFLVQCGDTVGISRELWGALMMRKEGTATGQVGAGELVTES